MIAKLIAWFLGFFGYVACERCNKMKRVDDLRVYPGPYDYAPICCSMCGYLMDRAYEYEFMMEEEARLLAEVEEYERRERERARFAEIRLSPEELERKLNEAWDNDPDVEIDEITLRELRISELDQRVRCECLDERVFDRCCELINPYEDDEDDSVPGHSPDPAVYGDVVDSYTWDMVRSA